MQTASTRPFPSHADPTGHVAGGASDPSLQRPGAGASHEPARTGRPSKCTPEVVRAMHALIRRYGISDSQAGLLAGISTTTVSRWKEENEAFAVQLGQARAQYDLDRLQAIRDYRRPNGSVDWRGQVWLLQHSSPEEYGKPARRAKFGKLPVDAVTPATAPGGFQAFIVTEEELEFLRAEEERKRTTGGLPTSEGSTPAPMAAAHEEVPKVPETQPASSQPAPGAPERPLQILPETREALPAGPTRAGARRPLEAQILPETPVAGARSIVPFTTEPWAHLDEEPMRSAM